MGDIDEMAEELKEMEVMHAARYLGLKIKGSCFTDSRKEPDGKSKFGHIWIVRGLTLAEWNCLNNNADAFELLTVGNLWQADEISQAYKHEAYVANPEKEIRRITTLVAAARWRQAAAHRAGFKPLSEGAKQ